MSIAENLSEAAFHKVALPMRLCDWRLSPNADGFAYGGEEVDLSVWDAERAFATSVQGAQEKKRKRGDTLLPGELWRAKNVSRYPPSKAVLRNYLLNRSQMTA